MAAITVDSKVKLSGLHSYLFDGTAGSALTRGTPCYIDSNGKILTSGCALVDETGHDMFVGINIYDVPSGEPCTLALAGTKLHIADATLTIGTRYFSGSVAGALVDSKTQAAANATPVAKAISTSDIIVVRTAY
jgi:hypothetical protein